MRHALRAGIDTRFPRDPETGLVDTSIDESTGELNGVYRDAKTNLHAKYEGDCGSGIGRRKNLHVAPLFSHPPGPAAGSCGPRK
jgi:hypothetical protein